MSRSKGVGEGRGGGALEEPGKEPIEILVLVKSSDLGFVK